MAERRQPRQRRVSRRITGDPLVPGIEVPRMPEPQSRPRAPPGCKQCVFGAARQLQDPGTAGDHGRNLLRMLPRIEISLEQQAGAGRQQRVRDPELNGERRPAEATGPGWVAGSRAPRTRFPCRCPWQRSATRCPAKPWRRAHSCRYRADPRSAAATAVAWFRSSVGPVASSAGHALAASTRGAVF